MVPTLSRRALLILLLSGALLTYASKQFVMPVAREAQTYPAHDVHGNENVTVAADPYDTEGKASVFTQKYAQNQILPIFVVVTNGGDQPIALENMTLQLVTQNDSKIQPANLDDLYRRFSKLKSRGDEPRRNPLPVPFPKKGPQAGVNSKAINEFNAAMFRARAVEPHSSHAGFFFFDIEGISQPLTGAHLYVTGIHDNNGQELMYLDIPLDKYLDSK
ncbi:MAG TPA: hypothetical protein VKW78_21720 [Terriglobales bacterium]|nr:hypothetical protein [Terriglobales bacterium]